jgi:hypothetical protein
MEEAVVTTFRQTADASGQYRDGTAANIARIASSSQCGNLADATKNSTVIVPAVTIVPAAPNPLADDRISSSVRR